MYKEMEHGNHHCSLFEHICDVTGQNQSPLVTCTNTVLSNFIGKITFFVQFHILVPNYSDGSYFLENETNLGLNFYRKDIKFKKFSSKLF